MEGELKILEYLTTCSATTILFLNVISLCLQLGHSIVIGGYLTPELDLFDVMETHRIDQYALYTLLNK